MALPIVTVALGFVGAYSRYVRSSMLVSLRAPYTVVARAKGLRERRVLVRHALRTALIPFVSVLVLDFGNLFAGALVADLIFRQQGLGIFFLSAISFADPNQLPAILTVLAVVVVGFSLVGDVVYGWLDPRIRLR
jgi:peptide/nickel transport system permease protein